MRIEFSPLALKELAKIKKKDKKLFQRIEKQLALFKSDSMHLSLRLHKLSGELEELWSISITRSIRMVYILAEETAYFIDIGSHDEVYKR